MADRRQLQLNRHIRSSVRLEGGWVYKQQPKFLCDNELWCLDAMWPSGYVPAAERFDVEIIRLQFIERQPVTDRASWMAHLELVLEALKMAGIRHGDLAQYSVIPHGNRPMLVDFAESRLWDDPRPDKRPEGDAYWLRKTLEYYAPGA